MKEKIISKIIIGVIVLVLCLPIIIEVVEKTTLKSIKYDDYLETIQGTSSYGFALIYIDDSSSKEVKENKKEIKTMMEEYLDNGVGTSVAAYYMDSKDMTDKELENAFNGSDIKSGYVFALNNEIIRTESIEIDDEELSGLVSIYSMNGVPEDLTYYKVAKDADTYKKLVKDKKTVTMAVFGRDNCFYCNQFKAVYNTVAEEHKIDIYYFDSTTYNSEEYKKIMNMGLTVPASCSDDGESFKLESGFGTPLTLFTKNGKVIDCISGYTNKANLVTKLKTVGLLKAE